MRSKRSHRRRGSLLIIVIVAMLVIAIMGLALMDEANATFQQSRRQPQLTSLQSLADAGAQYGYWQYTYNGAGLPFTTPSKVTVGPGAFLVTVTDSPSVTSTIQCVSTAYIGTDSYSVTKTYNKGSGGSSGPSAPTNLVANATTTNIGLTWTAVTGATSYNVYRGTAAGAESATALATGQPSASYTDSTAVSGTTYYYYVTAVTGGIESGHSNEANAKWSAGYVTVTPSTVSLSNYYGDIELKFVNTQPMTSLTVTIVFKKDAGSSYNGEWNNFWSGYINQSYVDNGTTITYASTETNGDSQTSGPYTIDAAFNLNNTVHLTSNDTYTVSVTAGGITQNISGHF